MSPSTTATAFALHAQTFKSSSLADPSSSASGLKSQSLNPSTLKPSISTSASPSASASPSISASASTSAYKPHSALSPHAPSSSPAPAPSPSVSPLNFPNPPHRQAHALANPVNSSPAYSNLAQSSPATTSTATATSPARILLKSPPLSKFFQFPGRNGTHQGAFVDRQTPHAHRPPPLSLKGSPATARGIATAAAAPAATPSPAFPSPFSQPQSQSTSQQDSPSTPFSRAYPAHAARHDSDPSTYDPDDDYEDSAPEPLRTRLAAPSPSQHANGDSHDSSAHHNDAMATAARSGPAPPRLRTSVGHQFEGAKWPNGRYGPSLSTQHGNLRDRGDSSLSGSRSATNPPSHSAFGRQEPPRSFTTPSPSNKSSSSRHHSPESPALATGPQRNLSSGSYKLQPVAYSPLPDDESGSDEDVASTKDRPDDTNDAAEPPDAPRLPLLYFEENHVDHIDFAYKSGSRETSQGNSRRPSHSDNQAAAEPTEPVPKLDRSLIEDLPRPPFAKPATSLDSPAKHRGETVTSPGDSSMQNPPQGKNETFFWHSPNPSTDHEGESPHEPDHTERSAVKPGQGGQPLRAGSKKGPGESLKVKTSHPSGTSHTLVSATALGFGGPSDWEHFGSYDGEEVDDIELYSSKPRESEETPRSLRHRNADAAEDFDSPHHAPAPAGIGKSTAAPAEDQTKTNTEHRSANPTQDPLNPEHDTSPKIGMLAAGLRDTIRISGIPSDIDTPPPSMPSSIPKTHETLPLDLQRSPPPAEDDTPTQPKQQFPPIDSIRDASESPSIPSDSVESTNTEDINQDRTPQTNAAPLQQLENMLPDEAARQYMSRVSLGTSILSSPIDDDDGKENIIISLQVPDARSHEYQHQTRGPPVSQSQHRPNNNNTPPARFEPQNLDSPELLRMGRRSIFPQSIQLEDPYFGLDPWAKASLNRYVKMLKEEAQATSDLDKYQTFLNFIQNETRLRSVLYDMDDDSDASGLFQSGEPGMLRPRVSVRSKALPALPRQDSPPVLPAVPVSSSPLRADPFSGSPSVSRTSPAKEQNNTTNANAGGNPAHPYFGSTAKVTDSPTTANEPSSYGDRSSPTKASGTREKVHSNFPASLNSLKKALEAVASRNSPKDSSFRQNPEENVPRAESNDHADTIDGIGASTGGAGSGMPKSPASFEGRAYEGDKAANRQTIYRPFSGLLRTTSVRHGMGEVEKVKSSDGKSAMSDAEPGEQPIKSSPKALDHQPSSSLPNSRLAILEPLLFTIAHDGTPQQQPSQLAKLQASMEALPDDFSFIHKTVLAWDAEAKKAREAYEEERHMRQQQNEERISTLFNSNEIGYGDIGELEGEFKRGEASKKAEEDREEVQTFVARVFDVVWARINYEMDQLQPLYEECTQIVGDASAGRDMFVDTDRRAPVAPAMEVLLILYQKLMVRHQKAFEAVLERDRRLKKTEVAPWYALGSIEKVKRIERRFEEAEKKAILEFCRQRDERANLLMDVLDQNTLRGVGANQDYMESIMQATHKVTLTLHAQHTRHRAQGRSPVGGSSIMSREGARSPHEPPSPLGLGSREDALAAREEVLKAQAATAALARSSQQIVQTFHVADMLLNAADYEVSVANAKLSNADAAAFRRLRDAKAKEDQKLSLDLEHRMSLIRGDTGRTQEEIGKLLALLAGGSSGSNNDIAHGNNAGGGGGAGSSSNPGNGAVTASHGPGTGTGSGMGMGMGMGMGNDVVSPATATGPATASASDVAVSAATMSVADSLLPSPAMPSPLTPGVSMAEEGGT